MRWLTSSWVIGLWVVATQAAAHQPVMDMAPRWAEGYGIQTRVEHFDSQTTTWIEGVYTWDRSIRGTFKLPIRDGRAGDLILGLPLKKYRNQGAHTSNWSITPSVQLPTGRDRDGNGEWDAGLSLSYSAETPKYYQLFDLYTLGDKIGLDINLGLSFPGKGPSSGTGRFAMWDLTVLTSDDGDRVQTGPVFVYFKDNMMLRAEYKALVYERDSDWSGGLINVGIGWVF